MLYGVMKPKNPIFAIGREYYKTCSPRISAHLRLHSWSFCIRHVAKYISYLSCTMQVQLLVQTGMLLAT